MRYKALAAARSYLLPLTAPLLATALGGCVAYTGSPGYSYAYPSSYYGGYPASWAYSYSYPSTYYAPGYVAPGYATAYSPNYNGGFDTYKTSGGGNQ
jgi:hypothetical protein